MKELTNFIEKTIKEKQVGVLLSSHKDFFGKELIENIFYSQNLIQANSWQELAKNIELNKKSFLFIDIFSSELKDLVNQFNIRIAQFQIMDRKTLDLFTFNFGSQKPAFFLVVQKEAAQLDNLADILNIPSTQIFNMKL